MIQKNTPSLNSSSVAYMVPEIYGMIDAHAYYNNITAWPVPLNYVQINSINEAVPIHFTNSKAAMNKLTFVDGVDISSLLTSEIGAHLVRLNSSMYNQENRNNYGFIRDFNKLLQIRVNIKELLNGRRREGLTGNEKSRLNNLEEEEKRLNQAMTDIYRKDVPSLMIFPTVDMELAHFDGYEGTFIYRYDEIARQIFYRHYGREELKYLSDDDSLMFQDWAQQILDTEAIVESNPLRLFPLFSYEPRRYRMIIVFPRLQ